jgi:hypothetical protein
MYMEKRYLLKLFLKWVEERIKENGAGGELKYNISDISSEPL